MSRFSIYNTLTRKKEEFCPLSPPYVKMYVCGITPYSDAHLGHARCYITFDVLRRFLEWLGFKVQYIQNITDIDDKIINASRETEVSPDEIARKYFESFSESMKELNVRPADNYPRVSETVKDIIEFAIDLISKGMAYERNGSVYFRVARFGQYGRLSGRSREEMVSGQEVSRDEKEDPMDFALWKRDEEFGWDSPWGKGRPGWHIECSAMSQKFLGDQFDIHGGGLDLIFPHHENEIAQSQALTGKKPVNYWVHNGMVTLKGDKMAKSTGNYFLLKELIKQVPPMVLRMYLLSVGYRQSLDFSMESLRDTQKAYNKLAEFKREIEEIDQKEISDIDLSRQDEIILALEDDLNTPRAIGEIFKKITPIMERLFSGAYTRDDIEEGKRIVLIFENILGINLEIKLEVDVKKIDELIKKREEYRKRKEFEQADKIRKKLNNMGIEIKDTPTGAKWHIKSRS